LVADTAWDDILIPRILARYISMDTTRFRRARSVNRRDRPPPIVDPARVERHGLRQGRRIALPGRHVSRRDRCQHGNARLDRGGEGTRQPAAILLEMTDLAQPQEVAARRDVTLHRFGRRQRAGGGEMAALRARSEILEDLEALAIRQADEIARGAGAIRQAVLL